MVHVRTYAACFRVLAGLDQKPLRAFRSLLQPITCARGQWLLQPPAPGKGLYLVGRGKLLCVEHSPGKEPRRHIRILGPGDLFGFEAMFDMPWPPVGVRALDRSSLCLVEKGDLTRFLRRHPVAAVTFLRQLARELKECQARLVEIAHEEGRVRLARLLLLLAQRFGVEDEEGLFLGVQLRRSELAEMIALSTETVVRLLKSLESDGAIAVAGARITITDRAALARHGHVASES